MFLFHISLSENRENFRHSWIVSDFSSYTLQYYAKETCVVTSCELVLK